VKSSRKKRRAASFEPFLCLTLIAPRASLIQDLWIDGHDRSRVALSLRRLGQEPSMNARCVAGSRSPPIPIPIPAAQLRACVRARALRDPKSSSNSNRACVRARTLRGRRIEFEFKPRLRARGGTSRPGNRVRIQTARFRAQRHSAAGNRVRIRTARFRAQRHFEAGESSSNSNRPCVRTEALRGRRIEFEFKPPLRARGGTSRPGNRVRIQTTRFRTQRHSAAEESSSNSNHALPHTEALRGRGIEFEFEPFFSHFRGERFATAENVGMRTV